MLKSSKYGDATTGTGVVTIFRCHSSERSYIVIGAKCFFFVAEPQVRGRCDNIKMVTCIPTLV
eukprot:2152317-Amphidinium_carterae.3